MLYEAATSPNASKAIPPREESIVPVMIITNTDMKANHREPESGYHSYGIFPPVVECDNETPK